MERKIGGRVKRGEILERVDGEENEWNIEWERKVEEIEYWE